ncbi:MAG: hypothetical protein Q8903_13220 [Bacteroidota bacterium]|nr:hypothetical protein [Bacteroidota bacterium]
MNYSCYSYFEVSQDKLLSGQPKVPVMFELKDTTKIETKVGDIKIEDGKVTIVQDSTNKIISLSDIKQISIEKFDLLKTLALPVLILALTAIFILMLFGLGVIPHFKIDG